MQPIIKQGWLRVLLFLICLLVIILFVGRLTLQIYSMTTARDSSRTLTSEQLLYTSLVLSSIASYLTVLFFRKVLDKQKVTTLGLQWENYKAHAATGFFLGILLLGAGTLLLIATGNLEWIDMMPDARSLFINLGLMVIIAFTEELVFRGYILNNLMQSMNKWIALFLSALLFAAFHSNN